MHPRLLKIIHNITPKDNHTLTAEISKAVKKAGLKKKVSYPEIQLAVKMVTHRQYKCNNMVTTKSDQNYYGMVECKYYKWER